MTFNTLADSVNRGCRICRSFWESLLESDRDKMRDYFTTAEEDYLTRMEIEYKTDRGYEIKVVRSGGLLIHYKPVMDYNLELGQCWPYFGKTEFD
jgi:hypothetical protein